MLKLSKAPHQLLRHSQNVILNHKQSLRNNLNRIINYVISLRDPVPSDQYPPILQASLARVHKY